MPDQDAGAVRRERKNRDAVTTEMRVVLEDMAGGGVLCKAYKSRWIEPARNAPGSPVTVESYRLLVRSEYVAFTREINGVKEYAITDAGRAALKDAPAADTGKDG